MTIKILVTTALITKSRHYSSEVLKWDTVIEVLVTFLNIHKRAKPLLKLTVADDSAQRISLEVKLNVHVLSLWKNKTCMFKTLFIV